MTDEVAKIQADRPTTDVVLRLRLARTDSYRRVSTLLKRLLRDHGLRCVSINGVPSDVDMRHPDFVRGHAHGQLIRAQHMVGRKGMVKLRGVTRFDPQYRTHGRRWYHYVQGFRAGRFGSPV
jgi:hypothetical protein